MPIKKSIAVLQRGSFKAGLHQPWKVISFVASIALFSMQGAHAQSANQGWYAGVNAGTAHSGLSGGDVDNAFANQGITSSTGTDKHDGVYSLDLGYKFHQNFAVEGGYVDLGRYDFNSNVSAPAADTASGNYRVKGWTASAVGILPIQNGFSAYGKLGLVYADTSLNAASNTGATNISSTSKWSTRPLVGLGVSYDITPQWAGKAEWNHYDGLGNASTGGRTNIDTYTLGVAYKF
ncbi:MAG TPA: outer membrane beta-barrel protein [Rhodocyclaceae bacterium]|jgi:OOP family OmpA-OmpF porin|nr:outer membrane beta-barrel protein [Rhodocyclaceae bacterium]